MEQIIADKLVAELLKHVDLSAFAKELAPTLLMAVEKRMIECATEMDWADFLFDTINNEAVCNVLTKRIVKSLA